MDAAHGQQGTHREDNGAEEKPNRQAREGEQEPELLAALFAGGGHEPWFASSSSGDGGGEAAGERQAYCVCSRQRPYRVLTDESRSKPKVFS